MSRESNHPEGSTGMVEAIYISLSAGKPMQRLSACEAFAGQGLAGDRYLKGAGYYSGRPLADGGRQITLLEAEELERLERETGIHLDPAENRRNVMTRSITVNDLIGARFQIGEVVCEGLAVCEPCTYLERLTAKRVMRPLLHRGGLRARIISCGTIRVGDEIHVSPGAPVESVEPPAAGVHDPSADTAAETDTQEAQADGTLSGMSGSTSSPASYRLLDTRTPHSTRWLVIRPNQRNIAGSNSRTTSARSKGIPALWACSKINSALGASYSQ